MNFKRLKGDVGEAYTQIWLRKNRYKITQTNYSCRFGEIDIIAQNKSCICFVEVKTRNAQSIDRPAAAVDMYKQSRIIKTAQHFLMGCPTQLQPRFDVAEVVMQGSEVIDFNYIENAFSL